MNALVMFLFALLAPVFQPIVQHGANRLHHRLQIPQENRRVGPQVATQPYVVYHNGEWWKFENNQWYVWRQQQP